MKTSKNLTFKSYKTIKIIMKVFPLKKIKMEKDSLFVKINSLIFLLKSPLFLRVLKNQFTTFMQSINRVETLAVKSIYQIIKITKFEVELIKNGPEEIGHIILNILGLVNGSGLIRSYHLT